MTNNNNDISKNRNNNSSNKNKNDTTNTTNENKKQNRNKNNDSTSSCSCSSSNNNKEPPPKKYGLESWILYINELRHAKSILKFANRFENSGLILGTAIIIYLQSTGKAGKYY